MITFAGLVSGSLSQQTSAFLVADLLRRIARSTLHHIALQRYVAINFEQYADFRRDWLGRNRLIITRAVRHLALADPFCQWSVGGIALRAL